MATTGDALLQAIHAEPGDDALRLIYADWLDDHGEGERAEFIRVEVALYAWDGDAPPPRHPGDDPEYARLDARRWELLHRHFAAWFGGVEGLVYHPRTTRGFVTHCEVPARWFAQDADLILDAAPLMESVFLNGIGTNMPAVAARPELARFRTVSFYDTTLGNRGLGHLLRSPHLARLRRLDVDRSRIDAAGAVALARSPVLAGLEEVRLAWNRIGDRGATALFAAPGLARLRAVDLGDCDLTDAVVPALVQAAERLELRSLRLATNGLTEVGAGLLADCAGLASLRLLDLRCNPLRGGVGRLARAARPAALEELRLGGVEATDGDLADLLRSALLRSIRRLDLARQPFGREALAALATPHLAGLTELDLTGCVTGPTGAAHLRPVAWPALRRLRLDRNPLGAAGVRALAAGPLLVPVTTLGLGYCDLDDDAAEALAAAETVGNLRQLILSGNRIGPRGARALLDSPHLVRLQSLSLRDNPIGRRADRAVVARFGPGSAT